MDDLPLPCGLVIQVISNLLPPRPHWGYRHFEELPVWKAAIDLAMRVYDFTEPGRLRRFSGLRDQLERAALSISNNIAEGFERGTTAELIAFLYIARGSAGEVRSMLILLERMVQDEMPGLTSIRMNVTDVSKQLGAWNSLAPERSAPGTTHSDRSTEGRTSSHPAARPVRRSSPPGPTAGTLSTRR